MSHLDVSLPLQRELIDTQLKLVEVLLKAEELSAQEYRVERAENDKKGKYESYFTRNLVALSEARTHDL